MDINEFKNLPRGTKLYVIPGRVRSANVEYITFGRVMDSSISAIKLNGYAIYTNGVNKYVEFFSDLVTLSPPRDNYDIF